MRFFNRSQSDLENGRKSPQPGRETRHASTYPHVSTPRSASPAESEKGTSLTSAEAKLLQELLEKFDPKPVNLPPIFPLNELRAMVRTLYLDNINCMTLKLHKHYWILLSSNEKYKELCTVSRYDQINEDLIRYTKAIRDYEYWLDSKFLKLEKDDSDFPPTYSTDARIFAILECARHHSSTLTPSERTLLASLSASCARDHIAWVRLHQGKLQTLSEKRHQVIMSRKALLRRMGMATFSGCTLIVPMLIMVLDQRRTTTLVTTSAFTLAIGLILAWWMDEGQGTDIIVATAGYAAVLVVFVGTNNF